MDNDNHEWMWNARIEEFFVYECEGILEVFLLTRYFDQRLPRENSRMSFLHEMSIIRILNLKPIE